MVALKYLTRKKDRYGLTPVAATFLVRSSDLYMEGGEKFASGHLMGWTEFGSAVVITTSFAIEDETFGRKGAQCGRDYSARLAEVASLTTFDRHAGDAP